MIQSWQSAHKWGQEPRSSSVHESGSCKCPDLVLKSGRVSEEPVAFRLCSKAKGADVSRRWHVQAAADLGLFGFQP